MRKDSWLLKCFTNCHTNILAVNTWSWNKKKYRPWCTCFGRQMRSTVFIYSDIVFNKLVHQWKMVLVARESVYQHFVLYTKSLYVLQITMYFCIIWNGSSTTSFIKFGHNYVLTQRPSTLAYTKYTTSANYCKCQSKD